MSLQGKNRKVFSYINKDCSGKEFSYQNFDKANCYHTSFKDAILNGASLMEAFYEFG